MLPGLGLVLLACIGLLVVPSASTAKLEKTLPLNPAQLDDSRLARALDLARHAGVTQIQAPATWWWLTRSGTYDWSDIDRLVAAAEARRMDVVLQLTGTPDWVHPDLPASVGGMMERIWHPPVRTLAELHRWAAFVGDVVARYRGRIKQYEMWNEPNSPEFWKPGPSVEEFARLMRWAYYAARKADPGAKVVLGGLSTNDIGFLSAYYDAADAQWHREARAESYFFDVLGVHPYSAERSPTIRSPEHRNIGPYGVVDRNFIGFRGLRRVTDARDTVPKPVFIGEYGFSTRKTWKPAVPDRLRARYLRRAYNLAADEEYVIGLAWYGYVPNTATGREWAIVDAHLNPSRTFKALRTVPSGEAPRLLDPSRRSE